MVQRDPGDNKEQLLLTHNLLLLLMQLFVLLLNLFTTILRMCHGIQTINGSPELLQILDLHFHLGDQVLPKLSVNADINNNDRQLSLRLWTEYY